MTQRIRKRCNNPKEPHDNEFTRDDLWRKLPVAKSASSHTSAELPERLVFPCRTCTEGRVVFSRSDLERVRQGG